MVLTYMSKFMGDVEEHGEAVLPDVLLGVPWDLARRVERR